MIDSTKAFIPKSLFLRASGFWLISTLRLDGRKYIQYEKSAWSGLHSDQVDIWKKNVFKWQIYQGMIH